MFNWHKFSSILPTTSSLLSIAQRRPGVPSSSYSVENAAYSASALHLPSTTAEIPVDSSLHEDRTVFTSTSPQPNMMGGMQRAGLVTMSAPSSIIQPGSRHRPPPLSMVRLRFEFVLQIYLPERKNELI